MSHQLINRNADLKQLRDEGYDIEVRAAHLLMKVPYVNSKRQIKLGVLVSTLDTAGDATVPPKNHVAFFAGEHPCNMDGSIIAGIQHQSRDQKIDDTITINHSFSARPKPKNKYDNYYDKMATYAAIISSPAHALDPSVKSQTFPVFEQAEEESVFRYMDTASSRAGICAVSSKLAIGSVAIIGLGGTGSYVLDLLAKTPVEAIHLFDGDDYLSHNAFRSPGAATLDDLRAKYKKVHYWAERYTAMRRNIIPHDIYINGSNVDLLAGMEFVFLSLDGGEVKKAIIAKLEELGIPFVDVGMGIHQVDDCLLGVLRVTSSTPGKREHVYENQRISFADAGLDNDYETNIQVADLNSLNAALAVIKWKKLFGFYKDLEQEHFCTYTIDGNHMCNEDQL